MRAAAPYVPRALLEHLAAEPDRRVRAVDGTCVFVDVSGFTSLSERLARRGGREGAEQLADAIGGCFEDLLGVAYDKGGGLLKFGGDALLLLFDGEAHLERACASAIAMNERLRERGPIDDGRGAGDAADVGRRPQRRVPAVRRRRLAPRAADRRPRGERRSCGWRSRRRAGEIVVSAATAAALPRAVRRRGARRRPAAARAAAGSSARYAAPLPEHDRRDARGRRALDRAARARARRPAAARAPDRHASRSCASRAPTRSSPSAAPTAAADALDALVRLVQDAADAEQVCFLGSDIDADGGKLILTAGRAARARRRGGADAARAAADRRRGPAAAAAHRRHPRAAVRRRHRAALPPHLHRDGRRGQPRGAADGERAAGRDLRDAAACWSARARGSRRRALEPLRVKGKALPVEAVAVGAVRARPRRGARRRAGALPARRPRPRARPDRARARRRPARARAPDRAGERARDGPLAADGGGARPRRRRAGAARDLRAVHGDDAVRDLARAAAPACSAWTRTTPTTSCSRGCARRSSATTRRCCRGCRCSPTRSTSRRRPARRSSSSRSELPRRPAARGRAALHAPPARRLGADRGGRRAPDGRGVGGAARRARARAAAAPVARRRLAARPRRRLHARRRREHVLRLELGPLGPDDTLALAEAVDRGGAAAAARRGARGRALGRQPAVPARPAARRRRRARRSCPTASRARRSPGSTARAGRTARSSGARRCSARASTRASSRTCSATTCPRRTATRGRGSALYFKEEPGGQLRFRREVVRDVAYAGLPFRVRRELHAAAAGRLERELGDDADDEAARLAVHFHRAGDHGKAWRYARLAADRASERAAFADAAGALPARARGRAPARRRRRASSRRSGSRSRRPTCAPASSSAPTTRSPRRAGSSSATRCAPPGCSGCTRASPIAPGQVARAVRWSGRALRALDGVDDDGAAACRAHVVATLAAVRQRQGRTARGDPARAPGDRRRRGGRRGARAGPRLPDARLGAGRVGPRGRGRPLRSARWRSSAGSAPSTASRACSTTWAASPTAPAAGTRPSSSTARAPTRARARATSTSPRSRTATSPRCCSDQGRLDEAEPLLRRALQVWRGTADEHGVAFATALLGRVHARAGRDEQAVELLDDALARFQRAGGRDRRRARRGAAGGGGAVRRPRGRGARARGGAVRGAPARRAARAAAAPRRRRGARPAGRRGRGGEGADGGARGRARAPSCRSRRCWRLTRSPARSRRTGLPPRARRADRPARHRAAPGAAAGAAARGGRAGRMTYPR